MDEDPAVRWERYYQAQEGRLPRQIFTDALVLFDKSGTITNARFAIDLGCGDGTETFRLLLKGWKVLAIDQEPGAIARVQSLTPHELQPHLETRVAPFENLTLPPADFVHAGFSLPFCHPTKFDPFGRKLLQPFAQAGYLPDNYLAFTIPGRPTKL
jgi:tellurite methyltransferase